MSNYTTTIKKAKHNPKTIIFLYAKKDTVFFHSVYVETAAGQAGRRVAGYISFSSRLVGLLHSPPYFSAV